MLVFPIVWMAGYARLTNHIPLRQDKAGVVEHWDTDCTKGAWGLSNLKCLITYRMKWLWSNGVN